MGDFMTQNSNRIDIDFTSKDGKTKLKGSLWKKDSAKTWILWIHGFAEHRLRYHDFANFLNENNINFFSFDLRGHGDSDGKRGLILDFNDYLDDVDAGVQEISKYTNEMFIAGHSMGGLILGRYLELRNPSIKIKASIFTCPFMGLGMPVPAWKRKLAELLSKPFPGLALPSGLDAKDLSHDESIVKAYIEDPKVFGNATARWFVECLKHQALVISEANKINIPTQVMQGMGDKIVNKNATKEFYDHLTVKDKNWIPYEGLYHEILNEKLPERKNVYMDVLNWINQHR